MSKESEEELLLFLANSGQVLTEEQRVMVLQYHRRTLEADELSERMQQVYPINRRNDMVQLRQRWEAKDPNVCKYDYGDRVTFKLKFTDAQRKAIEDGYLALRPPAELYTKEGWTYQAKVFARVVEGMGESIGAWQALTPEPQKSRRRTIEQIGVSVLKLDQLLNELDSQSMGFLYSHVVDALAVTGLQISEADNRMTSMLNHGFRSVVEGGEARQSLRSLTAILVDATTKAANDLPKYDFTEGDVRFVLARRLERRMLENMLPFEASETSFAAQCLRAMFELGGLDVEKVAYWIKKAIDHPDSWARFLQKNRERMG